MMADSAEKVELTEVVNGVAECEATESQPVTPAGEETKVEQAQSVDKKSKANSLTRFFSGGRKGKKEENAPKEGEPLMEGGEQKEELVADVELETKVDETEENKKKSSTLTRTREWLDAKKPHFGKKPTVVNGEATEAIERTPRKKPNDKVNEMTIGLNMMHRDENGVSNSVRAPFEEVFGEPDGTHSVNCEWKVAYLVYTNTLSFVYKVLAIIFGIPLALIWAFFYAILSCCYIWVVNPGAKWLKMFFSGPVSAYQWFIRSAMDPCYEAVARCWGKGTRNHYHHYEHVPKNDIEAVMDQ